MTDGTTAGGPTDTGIERHTLAVLVVNEPGVLARVIGLFSGRGYNIESLTVAEVSREQGREQSLSRITLVTSGTRMIIDQIKAQLERLVPIRTVRDLTEEGPFIARELALVKVGVDGAKRAEILRLAEESGARTLDSSNASLLFEVTETTDRIDRFLEQIAALGRLDVARTGVAALSRGPDVK